MFKKILIANRGEIACRIIKTAKRLGIQCVAVYSEADQSAQHVLQADEAYCIGPAPTQQSYLNAEKILAVALACGAEAIHPGYGFLSENAEFAAACVQAELIFIGPGADAIRAMGSKSAAKTIMAGAQVPLIPGYHGQQQDLAALQAAADQITYPVLLKAAAGGGGKGMRIVRQRSELKAAIAAAKREALASFGDDELLIEKYFINPRHVEIQVFADQAGNTVYLFERDCSLQRRHQKIIEEAPAPHLSPALRAAMGAAAVAAAKAIHYVGAGTIEFLVADNQFYFMEMNTRLQVEHPITEMITGVDLVEWQLKIACGEPLPLTQTELTLKGHAFEARIYAEDCYKDFLPATGKIIFMQTPPESAGVRLDSGIVAGDTISPYYDPMLSKLIVWDTDRTLALHKLSQALAQYQIVGLQTNLELLSNISQHSAFYAGNVHTGFIQQHAAELLQQNELTPAVQIVATLFILLQQQNAAKQAAPDSPWADTTGWRLNLPSQQQLHFRYVNHKIISNVVFLSDHYAITLNDKTFAVIGFLQNAQQLVFTLDQEHFTATLFYTASTLHVLLDGKRYQIVYESIDNQAFGLTTSEHTGGLTAPMPGKIVALCVNAGEPVAAGTTLVILEAMKMEHAIQAPYAGSVREWFYAVGDAVKEGSELLVFEEADKQ